MKTNGVSQEVFFYLRRSASRTISGPNGTNTDRCSSTPQSGGDGPVVNIDDAKFDEIVTSAGFHEWEPSGATLSMMRDDNDDDHQVPIHAAGTASEIGSSLSTDAPMTTPGQLRQQRRQRQRCARRRGTAESSLASSWASVRELARGGPAPPPPEPPKPPPPVPPLEPPPPFRQRWRWSPCWHRSRTPKSKPNRHRPSDRGTAPALAPRPRPRPRPCRCRQRDKPLPAAPPALRQLPRLRLRTQRQQARQRRRQIANARAGSGDRLRCCCCCCCCCCGREHGSGGGGAAAAGAPWPPRRRCCRLQHRRPRHEGVRALPTQPSRGRGGALQSPPRLPRAAVIAAPVVVRAQRSLRRSPPSSTASSARVSRRPPRAHFPTRAAVRRPRAVVGIGAGQRHGAKDLPSRRRRQRPSALGARARARRRQTQRESERKQEKEDGCRVSVFVIVVLRACEGERESVEG